MSLGNNIKYARKAAGLTQEDIAREIGVSKQTVQKYESGIITTISSDKIEIIAKLLRTTPAKLMGWEDNTSAQSFKLFSPNVTDDVVTFPVLGSIAAGYNEMAIEDWSGETIDVPRSFSRDEANPTFLFSRYTAIQCIPYTTPTIKSSFFGKPLSSAAEMSEPLYMMENARRLSVSKFLTIW